MSLSKNIILNPAANVINDSFLNLFHFFTAITATNTKNKNSYCLDICSTSSIFKLIIEGMAGESKASVENNFSLKYLITAAPKPSQRRSGVFIRNGYRFNTNYSQKFNKDTLLDIIPLDETSLFDINWKIEQKFPEWYSNNKFLSNPLYDYLLYIHDQTYFAGFWNVPFKKSNTNWNDFYIGDNRKIKVKMMNRTTMRLFTFYDQIKNCDFLSIKYDNDKDTMLIIMPREPLNRKELLDFFRINISGKDIVDFYTTNGKYDANYDTLSMPKFQIDCDWELNANHFSKPEYIFATDIYHCSYIRDIFNRNLNLKNMVNNLPIGGFESIKIKSNTRVVNKEDGTFIVTEGVCATTDFAYPKKKHLKIDKSFIFLILSKGIASHVGIYVG